MDEGQVYHDVERNVPGKVLRANERLALEIGVLKARIIELEAELENRAETLRQQSLLLETLGDEVRKSKEETQAAKEALERRTDELERALARLVRTQARLAESEKLVSVGLLAAGVAHEINNPLAVILQKTGWMQDLLDEEEFRKSENFQEFRTSVAKIEEHVERARKVVHNMLGYARRMEPRLEDVDVNQTINQTIDILENFARANNIDIQTDLMDSVPIIAGDQAQLQQVILNLISNAIDAIGKDGTVSVKSRADDSVIRVVIADTGPGIPENMQKKIFDPFFTTKSSGKGTGLGLWISYNIIEKLGGSLSLRSQVGQGAEFTITMPIVRPEKK
jgi:two-component system NtrC family sensor kinase